jgi:uncharacterized protein YjiS (DUF1127 family)
MIRTDIQSLNAIQSNQIVPAIVRNLRHIADLPANAIKTAYTWQQRASERHQLSQLTDHQLRDMGITYAAANQEVSKPFWVS